MEGQNDGLTAFIQTESPSVEIRTINAKLYGRNRSDEFAQTVRAEWLCQDLVHTRVPALPLIFSHDIAGDSDDGLTKAQLTNLPSCLVPVQF
jgi:hypothetical protein